MKMEISTGYSHGGKIELVDCNEPFKHAYYIQVLDREGNKTLPDKVLIGKDDLQRIARAVDKYKY